MDTRNRIPRVAYFCMEYGLNEEFKIYSGGLGILAGDILKSARDLEMPLIGIGILWRKGYTDQLIASDGTPYDVYPENHYDFLEDTGVTVNVDVRGENIACKVWKTDKYGNVPLYLLDASISGDKGSWITEKLYGGTSQDRIAQEIVLGIGGVRALRALDIDIDIYHFNEGHAVLAATELIREKIENIGLSFKEAWDATRKEIVFTTHTPVPEGNEVHGHDLLKYMGAYNSLTFEEMETLGGDTFNMTVAGLRLSYLANGVAELHGVTARRMWKNISESAPIISITNGVHPGTWQDAKIRQAYEDDEDLWDPHIEAKKRLLKEIQNRTGAHLNPDNIVIGFARRAAPYKRSDLIFYNRDLIKPLLDKGEVQLVFSGKAHPNDGAGKDIVKRIVAMSKRYPNSVVFLENYDMKIGKLLTRGCDVWLNNPRRPMEASGTSGMKAAMNGVLNLSVLDGWWPEGCEHGINGWQIGDKYEGLGQDEYDAQSLYRTLFEEVLPTYYKDRTKWMSMMRSSIDMSHQFSAHRMVKEYYQLMYDKM